MTSTIKCVILDDELLAISYLKLLCEQIEDVEVIKVFNNPLNFLAEIEQLDCDLCFLDIEMPGINGLQVAEKLFDKNIVFTTAYKEYAAEAFDLNVIDYIRKPIKRERLLQTIEKVKILLENSKNNFIEWNTNLGKSRIFTNQISYIKASEIDSRDKEIIMKDHSHIFLKNINFKTLLELLPSNDFAQINKKEIIALRCIKAFSSNEVLTNIPQHDGEQLLKLHLSEVYKKNLIEKFEK
ncbi:LytR/AlgR family response regulator transcription factor [Cloacibacterium sp.]|uniref:LytR/AlgR family response regulator transcription factor n=1 Tax=Cloacibacterium sp. TaxID=1913682 RepID=UPI0039E5017C